MFILLGETAAAREISEHLNNKRIEYKRIQTWSEKSSTQIPTAILDASHPSCGAKFTSLGKWCEHQGIPFLRLERPETQLPTNSLISSVHNWEEALLHLEQCVETLYQAKGRPVTIFATTGSHQLESMVNSSFASHVRFVVRVLPEGRIVQKCQDMGIHPKNIVAIQGPFSKELNRVLFKSYGADIILTRDSGSAGGTDTKILAALELGLKVVLLRKTKISGGLTMNNVNELLDWVDKYQQAEST
ncbi:precorrin-6A/cobalt-precorrin-6A reductase [Desulfitobacterium metallireducens]|uniref:Precorrin-6x reductase n=1 Tax=Desulfitobacterium metallireducens DSM 15288 TaxID=871968 RepID=W0EAP1_9FIRM|nr:precorrin-6A/cobalt-precorrin-6A reductase [Desulfitobacterium metallireducens]AHF06598.1 precorrin-6x reductase [Desulfitobacterium metallireducens DSM 15288]